MKLVKKPSPKDGWYEIQPAEAQSLLEHGAKNRPLKEFRAQRIAAEIQAGTWRPNGESIVFDERGRLIDGQTRLRGCVLANKSIIAYCVYEVPAKYFPSFDQGAARGGNDLAALIGFANANCVAALTRLALKYADGTITKTSVPPLSTEKLRLYMERNRDRLNDAVAVGCKYRKGIVKLIPLSHATFVYYMAAESQNGRASDFIEKLSTGAGLQKGDALLLFRQRMLDLVGQKHTLTQEHKLALMIKVWNAYLTRKSMGTLKWNPDVEAFPRLDVGQPVTD